MIILKILHTDRPKFIGNILEVMERRLSIELAREITDKSEITTS